MVIYIILLGYAIMRGAVQYPFREYVYRSLMLAALYWAQSARSCDFGQVEERTLNA
ncbi:hypothetical protein L286_02335 [Sphingobium sp. HDIP04]|nr:hypothetical protein L286_02335 [Sphingobium sp. HDIP04]